MKLILQKDFRLRGWLGSPFYLEYGPARTIRRLTRKEFAFLMLCDGKTEIGQGLPVPEPAWAREQGMIVPCPEGGTLLPEQEYKLYANRRVDSVALSVTGRCDLNCRHCFNAKDASPCTAEPTMDQLLSVLEQLDECGVGKVRVTGGEPLLRKNLLVLTAEMARRGIRISDMLTNGTRLTPELLDALEAQGHRSTWLVSFDGLGFHDWLRGVPGTEKRTLSAIKLLCDRGYRVQIHQCVWKDSLSSIRPTVLKMQEMGVACYRIVPVEPSLRWLETAPGQSISMEEWLEYIPDFLTWWYENGIKMDLSLWGYWVHVYGQNRVSVIPDLDSCSRTDASFACAVNRHRPLINADGSLVPCLALSGLTASMGIRYGNVYEGDRLRDIFTDSPFLTQITCTCGQLKERNAPCRDCRWRDRCGMGCRAEALGRGDHDLNGVDPRMCAFFNGGTYEKLIAIAERFGLEHNCRPLP